MKIKYQWHIKTLEQRLSSEYLLLTELEKQNWSSIVFLKLWNSFGLICIH